MSGFSYSLNGQAQWRANGAVLNRYGFPSFSQLVAG
jgi:hypothetical protein